MRLKIVNIRGGKECDILMDRQSPFGNPFAIHDRRDRETVCGMFDNYLGHNPTLMEDFLEELKKFKGQDIVTLGCWCAPQQCHVSSYVSRWDKLNKAECPSCGAPGFIDTATPSGEEVEDGAIWQIDDGSWECTECMYK